jgi:hypothetical protein
VRMRRLLSLDMTKARLRRLPCKNLEIALN